MAFDCFFGPGITSLSICVFLKPVFSDPPRGPAIGKKVRDIWPRKPRLGQAGVQNVSKDFGFWTGNHLDFGLLPRFGFWNVFLLT